jgi:peptidoglycan hydrolase-like protein with peptidoglycan-binding domain
MQRRDPGTFAQIFGANAEALLATTNSVTPEQRLQSVGGDALSSPAWIDRFRRAGQVPAFQNAQNEEAIEGQFRPMLKIAAGLGLTSDRTLAMAYDRVVTRGLGGGLNWVVRAGGPLRTSAQQLHALQVLGYNDVAEFQSANGIPRDGVFSPETHAAVVGALRLHDAIPLPSHAELVCRMIAGASGTVRDRLTRLRDSTQLNDTVYDLP